jgi:hypothetical protein
MLLSRRMKYHFTFICSCKNIWITHYHSSEYDIVLKKVLLGTNYNICQYMLVMWHMSQLHEVMLILSSREMKHHFTLIWMCKNI